jgi:hypothetical protein
MPGRVYAAAVITLLVLIISTFPHRVAHFDDAWGAELAYWLVQKGHVRSEMFQGIGNGTEQHVYVFHKAFTYCQAALLHVLGFDLYAVKTIGLVFSVIGLLLLLQYFREWREARWLATFLYLGCGALISAAFIGRPEPMVMSAGLASFLVLRGASARPYFSDGWWLMAARPAHGAARTACLRDGWNNNRKLIPPRRNHQPRAASIISPVCWCASHAV